MQNSDHDGVDTQTPPKAVSASGQDTPPKAVSSNGQAKPLKAVRARAYVQELKTPIDLPQPAADKFDADRGGDWFQEMLRRQLNFAMTELKACQYKCRWLELKVASRDDQLKYMPDLFSKALLSAAFESENEELKRENELLRTTLDQMRNDMKRQSLSRRIMDRFFGAA